MERACEACGAVNRIPPKHLAHKGKCGSCKATLGPAKEPLSVDDSDFDDVIAAVKEPVLIDFYADWCPPCRAAAPHVAQVARDLAGQVVVLKVNTDKAPRISQRYRIQSIPTFMVLHDGKKVLEQAGMVDQRTMKGWLASSAASERQA